MDYRDHSHHWIAREKGCCRSCNHGCQMAIANYLDCIHLTLRAWGTMALLRYIAKCDPLLSSTLSQSKKGRDQILSSGHSGCHDSRWLISWLDLIPTLAQFSDSRQLVFLRFCRQSCNWQQLTEIDVSVANRTTTHKSSDVGPIGVKVRSKFQRLSSELQNVAKGLVNRMHFWQSSPWGDANIFTKPSATVSIF